jgi:hypothetical protein
MLRTSLAPAGARRYRGEMKRKAPRTAKSVAVLRRRGMRSLKRAIHRMRVFLGVDPRMMRSRAANDPKA